MHKDLYIRRREQVISNNYLNWFVTIHDAAGIRDRTYK